MKTNQLGDTFTHIPDSKQSEKLRTEAKEFKHALERSRKRAIKRGSNYCSKVRDILRNSEKYAEFQKQLYMYSNGVLDLTEFLNLVDDKVRQNEGLMYRFDDFLEDCERSGNRSDLEP